MSIKFCYNWPRRKLNVINILTTRIKSPWKIKGYALHLNKLESLSPKFCSGELIFIIGTRYGLHTNPNDQNKKQTHCLTHSLGVHKTIQSVSNVGITNKLDFMTL